MILTGTNINHYLFDKGYVEVEDFVKGDFSVHPTSHRNNSFFINRDKKANSLFIKQLQAFEVDKIETMKTEATCYWLANNETAYSNLKQFLPKYYDFDYLNHVLILENLSGYESLYEFYHKHRKFPLEIAEKHAELLASFQKNIFETIKDSQSFKLFRKMQPMVFQLASSQHRFWADTANKAEQKMIQLITQNADYQVLISKIKDDWEATSLTHNDIKPLNFLINSDCFEQKNYSLRLIDWETADIGDPCWDVAAVFQSYLFFWIYAEPLAGNPYAEQFTKYGFELEEMQPSIRRFWKTYCELMGFTKDESERKLLKSTNFCAMKLIHTCFETTPTSKDGLSPHAARMLQLSLNILKNPKESIKELFSL
jgi:thiamine kinase-like enzyme